MGSITRDALPASRHLSYSDTLQTLSNLQPFVECTTKPPMSQPTRHARAIDTGTSIGPQTSPAISDSSQNCLGSIRSIKKGLHRRHRQNYLRRAGLETSPGDPEQSGSRGLPCRSAHQWDRRVSSRRSRPARCRVSGAPPRRLSSSWYRHRPREAGTPRIHRGSPRTRAGRKTPHRGFETSCGSGTSCPYSRRQWSGQLRFSQDW
jgi:hypothetical protein